jgi:hypothetical protein
MIPAKYDAAIMISMMPVLVASVWAFHAGDFSVRLLASAIAVSWSCLAAAALVRRLAAAFHS